MVLKFFDAVLKVDLQTGRFLKFTKKFSSGSYTTGSYKRRLRVSRKISNAQNKDHFQFFWYGLVEYLRENLREVNEFFSTKSQLFDDGRLTTIPLSNIYLHCIFAILQFEILILMNWIFTLV